MFNIPIVGATVKFVVSPYYTNLLFISSSFFCVKLYRDSSVLNSFIVLLDEACTS